MYNIWIPFSSLLFSVKKSTSWFSSEISLSETRWLLLLLKAPPSLIWLLCDNLDIEAGGGSAEF